MPDLWLQDVRTGDAPACEVHRRVAATGTHERSGRELVIVEEQVTAPSLSETREGGFRPIGHLTSDPDKRVALCGADIIGIPVDDMDYEKCAECCHILDMLFARNW